MESGELLARANAVLRNCYVPYSGLRIAAALECEDGQVFAGCNVENASYGVTMCAEQVAVGHAVCEGVQSFRAIAIQSTGEDIPWPCGRCLQTLGEFCDELVIYCANGRGDFRKTMLSSLLPRKFELRPRRPAESEGASE